MAVILVFSSSGVHARSEKTNVIKCLRSGRIGRALDCYRSSTVGICTNGVDPCHDFDGPFCVNNCCSWSSEIVLLYVKKFYIWRSYDISSLIITFCEGSSLYFVFTVVRLSSKTPRLLFRSDMTHECAL